jgi:hypothetical protein
MQAYANLLPSNTQVYGNPTGGLQDNGETITLVDNNRAVVFSFRYFFVFFLLLELTISSRYSDDSENFPAAADGFGASLELVCDTVTNFSDPNSWVASPLPGRSDGLIEFSGSPGKF